MPGAMKKCLRTLDEAAGSATVSTLAVVLDPPAGIRERMAMGALSGTHQGWKDATHTFLLALTDREIIEIRAGTGLLAGRAKVHRTPLSAIQDIHTDSPRMARSVGTKIPLLLVETDGDTGVWKFANDAERDEFADRIRELLRA